MIRTFIALELPADLKAELIKVISRFRHRIPQGANWVKPENLHITMVFIGDVPPERIAEIDEAIQMLLEGFPAFNFKALGLELVSSRERQVLWAKLEAENDDVFKLQRRMIGSLRKLDIPPDRKPLKLHITLARLKTAVEPELAREIMQCEINKQSRAYESLCLFRSVLTPSGPNYSVIEQYKLK